MILPILKYGSPTLRKKAFDIDKEDSFLELGQNMMATLKDSGGVGLAGPQVGMLKNIFIIDTNPFKDQGIEIIERVFFNPVIKNYSEESVYYNESCLSIPGISEHILRPEKIEVRYRDENFDWQDEVFEGIIARIFQHEFDHLEGVLFIDRLSPLKKKLIKGKLRDIKKNIIK